MTLSTTSGSSSANLPPLYYRLTMQLLKPLYRFKLGFGDSSSQKTVGSVPQAQEIHERFGQAYPPRPQRQQVIWCHAVSLGETNTIAAMLDELMDRGYGIWLTNTTHTGYARSQERFASAIQSGRLSHSYVPVDSPKVIEYFLQHVRPCLAMFVETELWASILYILAQQQIPSVLVNARLSAKSLQNYQKIPAVSRSMMDNISLIIAQDALSAKSFRRLGAPSRKIRRASSLKWSINACSTDHLTPPPHTLTNKRPIWVAASTHDKEEQAVLSAHKQLLTQQGLSSTLLILVPRHPERFDVVANLITNTGLSYTRRSQNQMITEETQVHLADSMGELMRWYQMADVAFVGGSLVDVGGHNPIEPASVGTPIIMGKYTQSCDQLVDELHVAGGLQQVGDDQDINALQQALKLWLSDTGLAKQAGQAAYDQVQLHQNAMQAQLAMILDLLPPYHGIEIGEIEVKNHKPNELETPVQET